MKKRSLGQLFGIALCGLTLWGCGSPLGDFLRRSFVPERFDKASMVLSTLEAVVTPGYIRFTDASKQLEQALLQLQESPDESHLRAAREAWKSAAMAWNATEAYQFGPATEERIRQQIHFWPRRKDDIQELLNRPETLDTNSRFGATRKGLPVIEYLLFGEPAATLLQAEGTRARRYAALLSQDLSRQAQKLSDHWGDETEQTHFASSDDALNQQVNHWVMMLEDFQLKRLGAPLGKDNGGVLDPNDLESPDAQYSTVLLQATLENWARLLSNGDAPGMTDYLIELGQRPLVHQLNTEIEKMQTQLADVGPLKQALQNQPEAVEKLYASSRNLLRLVKVDLANALNTTVFFTSNDGD